eukprot:8298559-Alexandrium_andersonii.AAC.1
MQWRAGGPTPAGSAHPSQRAVLPTTSGNCWTVEGPCFGNWSKAFRPSLSCSLPVDRPGAGVAVLARAGGSIRSGLRLLGAE